MSGLDRVARLVGAAVLGTVALATPAGAQDDTTTGEGSTTRERGLVVECSGTWRDQPVLVTVHEDHPDLRELVLAVGKDDEEVVKVRTPGHRLVRHRGLRETGWLGGRRFDLDGVVVRDGEPVEVHEEHDDAGQHVVVDGVHHPLAATLTLTWRHRATTLGCADAYRYDLTVTRTGTTGDDSTP